MKTVGANSLMSRLLRLTAAAVFRHPRWFIWPQIVLFGVSVWFTIEYLQFDADRDHLVGAHEKYEQIFLNYKKQFPLPDDIVAVVQSEDPEKNRQFVERLGKKLEDNPAKYEIPVTNSDGTVTQKTIQTNLFVDVMFRHDLPMLGQKALQFVPEDDLKALVQQLQDYKPFIKKFARADNLVSFFDFINTQFRTSGQKENADTDSLIKALPVLQRIIEQASDCLRRPGLPPSPGVSALFGAGDAADTYIAYDKGRIFLLTAHAPVDDLNNDAVERMRDLVAQTQHEVPGVNVGITGDPVLEHDEMAQSQRDGTLASIVSLILSAMIFIYGYQETGRPVKAVLCLLVGLGYTLAFATISVGHLNILTITFLPMLIGLAIDYGVHLVTRYEEEMRLGHTEEEALTKAMVYTGKGIFTGGLTTAGGFLAMSFTHFKGLQEMGIICGCGLLVCMVPMLTMLPALLLRGRQNVMDHDIAEKMNARARIERVWLQRPILVTGIIVTLTALAATQWHKVYFNYNLLDMQSKGLPAVEFERLLIDSTPQSVLFGVVTATNLDQAVDLEKKLKALPTVSEVDTISDYLKEDQTAKFKLIKQIKENLADIQFSDPDRKPVNLNALGLSLYSFMGYIGAAMDQIPQDQTNLINQLHSIHGAIEDLRGQLFPDGPEAQEAISQKLGAFQLALFNDVHDTFDALRHQDDSDKNRVADLPPALRDRFVGINGEQLLQVYPREDVWQRKNQKVFVEQLRSVDPDVTGEPVQLYEYTNQLVTSYIQAAYYSLAAIVILVFFHFRSFSSVFLSLLPVAVGCSWLAGIMGYYHIPLNPANIMTLPLVIGIGVTNGIQILNRFAEEHQPGILAKSTGKAVLISGLTAISGFGSLLLAKHQGIHSLGQVMAIGIAACMIAALTFVPALLNLFMRRDLDKKQPSADNALSTLGREEPR